MSSNTPTLEGREPSQSAPETSRTATLRARARLRALGARLWLALPLVLVVLADVTLRGDRLARLPLRYLGSYAFAMLESGLLWAILLTAAVARRGAFRFLAAAAFVILATVSVGSQVYFHKSFSTYLNLDATLFGTSLGASVFGQLRADGSNFLSSVAPPLFAAIALLGLGRRIVRPRARARRVANGLAPVVVALVFIVPCSYRRVQASTPDVIYFHAMGGLIKQLTGVRTTAQIRPGLRTPSKLPSVSPAPTPMRRNVVLIITESVRSDVHCSAHVESCPGAEATNRAAPSRLPLLQMRSNASTTAIELAVLWSGLSPTSSRADLHSYPLLFDYAHAAGIENAYWTSHHMLFANSRLYVQDLPTKYQCGATDLDPLADIDVGGPDDKLAARAMREIPTMKEPFLGVVHFGNTHVPYRVDPSDAPFQPSLESKAPSDNEAYRNYYRNAVHLQDKAIGSVVDAIRKSPFGPRTVIVFTSDHGEGFREHAQLGHTGSIYDEEIHVPFWIDAPPGTLTDAERAAVEAARDAYHFHTDVTPTVLDLLGMLDAPAFATYRRAMPGESLLRPAKPEKPAFITNCGELWGCAFKNWGLMQGSRKLLAREWDDRWRCHDVARDPGEQHELEIDGCADLVPLAEQAYGGIPSAR